MHNEEKHISTICTVWFQCDDATYYTSRETLQVLQETFTGRVIS